MKRFLLSRKEIYEAGTNDSLDALIAIKLMDNKFDIKKPIIKRQDYDSFCYIFEQED